MKFMVHCAVNTIYNLVFRGQWNHTNARAVKNNEPQTNNHWTVINPWMAMWEGLLPYKIILIKSHSSPIQAREIHESRILVSPMSSVPTSTSVACIESESTVQTILFTPHWLNLFLIKHWTCFAPNNGASVSNVGMCCCPVRHNHYCCCGCCLRPDA